MQRVWRALKEKFHKKEYNTRKEVTEQIIKERGNRRNSGNSGTQVTDVTLGVNSCIFTYKYCCFLKSFCVTEDVTPVV